MSRLFLQVCTGNSEDPKYKTFLIELLERECKQRKKNRIDRRLNQSDFPYKKYLEDIEVEELPEDCQDKFHELKSLLFIEKGNNVIFTGSSGTGKTHMAIGLGIRACMKDYKVCFKKVPSLIVSIKEAKDKEKLKNLRNRFKKYDLVVLDELGYTSLDREEAELLFEHLSLRTGRKSTIITTNLAFDKWDELFNDAIMASTFIDRITYRAIIVNMNGKSYRYKKTKENQN